MKPSSGKTPGSRIGVFGDPAASDTYHAASGGWVTMQWAAVTKTLSETTKPEHQMNGACGPSPSGSAASTPTYGWPARSGTPSSIANAGVAASVAVTSAAFAPSVRQRTMGSPDDGQ